jgi:hypothetical protein
VNFSDKEPELKGWYLWRFNSDDEPHTWETIWIEGKLKYPMIGEFAGPFLVGRKRKG